MAGHSQFKNIMFRKGRQDKERSKLFSKLAREITVASKLGLPDPDAQPPPARRHHRGQAQNTCPRTISSAPSKRGRAARPRIYEEVRYEGYGPGGVALIVEALTDNRNRTAADVRAAFSKYGGALGETNSVSFMFNRVGEHRLPEGQGQRRCHAGSGHRGGRG